jgi:hypothetical protein
MAPRSVGDEVGHGARDGGVAGEELIVSITVAHGKLQLAMALGGAGETFRRTFYTLVGLATTHHRAAVATHFRHSNSTYIILCKSLCCYVSIGMQQAPSLSAAEGTAV